MCLIAIAWNAHPRFPLILVANRDEFHARPTAALAHWEGSPRIVGGRDLREGGGWLALDADRPRLAAVTNVREPLPVPARRSRGALVRDYLAGDRHATDFAEDLFVDGPDYGGFNLLLWEDRELVYATNRVEPSWQTVPQGVHGLSNGRFDAPWPKACRLTAALQGWLAGIDSDGRTDPDLAPLFAALADEGRAADAELPDTGVGMELERLLSPPFIRGTAYGTRASSVVLVDARGDRRFVERRFGPDGAIGGTCEWRG